MKLVLGILALTFVLGNYASASSPDPIIRVKCTEIRFDDLVGIEIQETDLQGQFVMVQTLRNPSTKKMDYKFSPVFSMVEIEKSEMPALQPWNGYTRTLVRYGRDNYSILTQDECTQSITTLNCKESFDSRYGL